MSTLAIAFMQLTELPRSAQPLVQHDRAQLNPLAALAMILADFWKEPGTENRREDGKPSRRDLQGCTRISIASVPPPANVWLPFGVPTVPAAATTDPVAFETDPVGVINTEVGALTVLAA